METETATERKRGKKAPTKQITEKAAAAAKAATAVNSINPVFK